MLREVFLKRNVFITFIALALLTNIYVNIGIASIERQFDFERDRFSFHNFGHTRHVSVEEVQRVLESADWTSSLPDWSLNLLANYIVEENKDSLGNCFGMSYTAKYYYDNPELFKVNYPYYSNLSEISLSQISPEIVYNQEVGYYIIQPYLYNSIIFNYGLLNIDQQIPYIQSQLDNNFPEIVVFDVNWDWLNGYHAVLAYDYSITDENNGQEKEVILKLYDSNFPSGSQSLSFFLSREGHYTLQKSYLTDHYNITKLRAATCVDPDWEFVLENRGKIIQLTLDSIRDQMPVEDFFIFVITALSVVVTALVVVVIILLVVIRKRK